MRAAHELHTKIYGCKLQPRRRCLPKKRLTVATEKPVEHGLLPTATELFALVHQGLLHRIVSTQHHSPPGPQMDGVDRAVLVTDLEEREELRVKRNGGGRGVRAQPELQLDLQLGQSVRVSQNPGWTLSWDRAMIRML